jgi:sec-independent protein translocase protein TatA
VVTPLDLVLQVGGLRGIDWMIIIGVVLLLIFGVNKIPQLAKSFGRAKGQYEKAKIEMRREVDRIKTGVTSERQKP